MRRNTALFAFGDPNQTVAGDNETPSCLKDIAEAYQLRQMMGRQRWIFGGNRDFDQGCKFFRREKLGSVNSHRLLAINTGAWFPKFVFLFSGHRHELRKVIGRPKSTATPEREVPPQP